MADPVLLTDIRIWNGGYALEGSQNKVSFTLSNAPLPCNVFGDTVEANYPGRVQPQFNASGYYSASTLANGEPDPVLFARLHSDATSWPVTLCPPNAPAAAAGADGNLAYTMTGAEFEYAVSGAHGELLPYTMRKLPRSGGAVVRGTVLLPRSTYSATTTGTGRQLGVLASTHQLVTVLHVFAINGGSWVLTVESDDNSGFTSATTRQTFTAVTSAPNRAVVMTAGPIATDDYWRVVLTKTGGTSINAAVALGFAAM